MKLISLITHRITLGIILCIWCVLATASNKHFYYVDYKIKLLPTSKTAQVTIDLRKNAKYVRWIRLKINPKLHSDFKGSGNIEVGDDYVLWKPGSKPSSLLFTVQITQQRKPGRYDALFKEDWALFRGDDLIPPARVDMQDGSQSRSKLYFDLPKGWSVATPYPRYSSGALKIDNPRRLFDRPTGWMVAGKLGVKREKIQGVSVAIAAPKKQLAHRLDIMALLNWNLPVFLNIFPNFPKRIVIVSAGDPMWRGALSGPSSLFLHADRPLITEDGTSPPLHELIHVAMSARAEPGADWLVEGLAEYYSLEIMRRSGTISQDRFEKSLKHLRDRGKKISRLAVDRSYGPITAKAVGILHKVDQEIRNKTQNKASLDDIIRELAKPNIPITLQTTQKIAEKIAGSPLESLQNIR